jgi:hypothetical protein
MTKGVVMFRVIHDEAVYISPITNQIKITIPLTDEAQLQIFHSQFMNRIFVKPLWF